MEYTWLPFSIDTGQGQHPSCLPSRAPIQTLYGSSANLSAGLKRKSNGKTLFRPRTVRGCQMRDTWRTSWCKSTDEMRYSQKAMGLGLLPHCPRCSRRPRCSWRPRCSHFPLLIS
ncbi:unnamed protein product, partial [Ectocarpus sp. 12 AP-2014]